MALETTIKYYFFFLANLTHGRMICPVKCELETRVNGIKQN